MKPLADHASVLRRIRGLSVAVVHPQDQDGEELLAQLSRIGCDVHAAWPQLETLPDETGLVLMAVRPETLRVQYPWLNRPGTPAVIAVVTYESPVTIEAVLQLDARATLASPVRSFGLLTAMALALSQHARHQSRERYIQRLEQKSAQQRIVLQAKQLMMRTRGVSEDEAYALLRSESMVRRAQIEQVAHEIVEAHKLLGL